MSDTHRGRQRLTLSQVFTDESSGCDSDYVDLLEEDRYFTSIIEDTGGQVK